MTVSVMDRGMLSLETEEPVRKLFRLETRGMLFILAVSAPRTLPGIQYVLSKHFLN